MLPNPYRSIVILLVCVRILSSQPSKVHGLTSKDIVLRHKQAQVRLPHHLHMHVPSQEMNAQKKLTAIDGNSTIQELELHTQRVLEDVSIQGKNVQKTPTSLNRTFDPYQSSKRRVPKGSDPIHNRS